MMSVTELRREAVATRLSRKRYLPSHPLCTCPTILTTDFRDALGRRKGVLTELFYFTKHPDVPPDCESVIELAVAESDDLKDFLTANDLER